MRSGLAADFWIGSQKSAAKTKGQVMLAATMILTLVWEIWTDCENIFLTDGQRYINSESYQNPENLDVLHTE